MDISNLTKVTLCGTALTSVRGWWTKPTSIMDLNPAEIHDHIFRRTRSGEMQAYEYREGPIANLSGVDSAFFRELVKYLQDNGLTDLLGLEILAEEVPDMMCEFVLKDNGTVILDARDVKKWESYRLTGFALNAPGMIELKGNESHSNTVKGTHQVFIDGKIGKEDPFVDVLKAEDIIH